MIYYRILSKVTIYKEPFYYLSNNELKYKESINVLGSYYTKMMVYKDFYSCYSIPKLDILSEDLFTLLDYKGVETFFGVIQTYNKKLQDANATYIPFVEDSIILLKDIERTLLYWDDYN